MAIATKKKGHASASTQIRERAAAQLAEQQSRLLGLQQQQEQARAERDQLLTEQAQRADHLSTLHKNVRDLERRHTDAINYASFAQGTTHELDATRQASDIEEQRDQARQYHADRQKEYSAADTAATARLAEIDTQLQAWNEEAQQAQSRIAEIERVRDQAHRDLGQQTYDAEMASYGELQARIDAAKQELARLQIQRQQRIQASAETLKDWPDLRMQMLELDPHDDATTRIITACLDYLRTLERDRMELRDTIGVPAVHDLFSWWQLLKVDEMLGYFELKSHQGQEAIQHHIARLEQALTQYREKQSSL